MKVVLRVFAVLLLVGVVGLVYQIRAARRTLAPHPVEPAVADEPSRPSRPSVPSVPSVPSLPAPSLPVAPTLRAPIAAPSPPTARPASPFADPQFLSDPERRNASIPTAVAVAAAEHGATTLERQNALGWLSTNGGPAQIPLFVRLGAADPDPKVRTSARIAASVMRSRFPLEEQ